MTEGERLLEENIGTKNPHGRDDEYRQGIISAEILRALETKAGDANMTPLCLRLPHVGG
jgi:hypothetical protein